MNFLATDRFKRSRTTFFLYLSLFVASISNVFLGEVIVRCNYDWLPITDYVLGKRTGSFIVLAVFSGISLNMVKLNIGLHTKVSVLNVVTSLLVPIFLVTTILFASFVYGLFYESIGITIGYVILVLSFQKVLDTVYRSNLEYISLALLVSISSAMFWFLIVPYVPEFFLFFYISCFVVLIFYPDLKHRIRLLKENFILKDQKVIRSIAETIYNFSVVLPLWVVDEDLAEQLAIIILFIGLIMAVYRPAQLFFFDSLLKNADNSKYFKSRMLITILLISFAISAISFFFLKLLKLNEVLALFDLLTVRDLFALSVYIGILIIYNYLRSIADVIFDVDQVGIILIFSSIIVCLFAVLARSLWVIEFSLALGLVISCLMFYRKLVRNA
ncbi:hypothetical protein [Cyclobacterium xiamenense]|uniref:hypothetical protein n=1 Tax=Cyclobacterium xiamenense TaxID=1297121 RepID=UPI0035CFD21A